MNKQKRFSDYPKTGLKPHLTLTYCHMFKSEAFFVKKAEIEHVLSVFLMSLYIICIGVCVSPIVFAYERLFFEEIC